jgi:hypothetical protein
MCKCGHTAWEHELDDLDVHEDGDETLYFGACEHKNCECKYYEEKE